jgi:murein tripeptide amidase MpaA
LINSRIHPGETNGSWVCLGIIKYLLSDDPIAVLLRKQVLFKIVPMLNVDGVVAGNYRTGLQGKDLNRAFMPSKHASVYPEV